MKRYMTVFLALTLIFSCVSVVNASAINEVTPEEIQIAVSDYVEDWVQDTYSNHYDMSDFEVSFFSTTISSNQYETYGTVSYSASLAYDTVDDMPLVKGAQDILGITSMESTLKSKSLESTSLDLSTVQTYAEECTRDECTAGNIMLTSSSHVVMVTYNDGEKVKFTGHTNDRRDVVISDSKALTYYLIK